MLYKVVLNFESVDEILKCGYFCGAVYDQSKALVNQLMNIEGFKQGLNVVALCPVIYLI